MKKISRNDPLSAYIAKIISDVRTNGDKAVASYTAKYDAVRVAPSKFAVSPAELKNSGRYVEAPLKKAIAAAAKNIRAFHEKELSMGRRSWKMRSGGAVLGQVYNPVETAGIYVPGGRYPYPSTVLMTVIPAKTAGVKRIIMMTPPGNATPAVLYAAYISGVTKVFRVNGPAGIAAMALGTAAIPKADLIAGPGNAFVNEVKRQVMGLVGIDSLAGPSEVAIIADSSANPDFIVYDILAQLEHDPDAKAYLFSDSRVLLSSVKASMKSKGASGFISAFCSIAKAVEKVNGIAPEHLQLMTRNAARLASRIRNAGAIFLGNYTPTAVGDYWAGPSHVLPTAGAARFSGGISTATFLKKTSYVEYNKQKCRRAAPGIRTLAGAEGLENHGKSIEIRTRRI
jgi:histidinol dehydrogenase